MENLSLDSQPVPFLTEDLSGILKTGAYCDNPGDLETAQRGWEVPDLGCFAWMCGAPISQMQANPGDLKLGKRFKPTI